MIIKIVLVLILAWLGGIGVATLERHYEHLPKGLRLVVSLIIQIALIALILSIVLIVLTVI